MAKVVIQACRTKIRCMTCSCATTRYGVYNYAEAYPCQAGAHKWMVTSLYNQMKPENLSEAELRKVCRKELEKMSCRIHDGDSIP